MSTSSSSLPFLLFFFLHLLLFPPCSRCCSRHLLLHGDANSSSSLADMLQARDGNVTDGLRRYLARFGYASTPDDADGQLVVRLYQSTLGLPVTGRLDGRTLDLLATPRCGVPDLDLNTHNNATARFAFFAGQPRWARAPGHFLLTYAVLSDTPYQPLPLPRGAVRAAFRRAFARWARVIPVRFRETRDYNTADVSVGFLAGDHGDGEPFDGPPRLLPAQRPAPPRRRRAMGRPRPRRRPRRGRRGPRVGGHARDRPRAGPGALVRAGRRHVPEPEAGRPQGGPHPGRRPRRAGALRLQPALQPQLPLRARHLLSRPGGGHHQVAREDDDAHGHPALACHRHSSAPPLLA